MRHSDFSIGMQFMNAIGCWRCTDIGTRTIAAIRLPDPVRERELAGLGEAMLAGPPYMLAERVFDEKDMAGAWTDERAMADERMQALGLHPGFTLAEVRRMMDERARMREALGDETAKVMAPILRIDRVREGRVLHPYSLDRKDGHTQVLALDIFSRELVGIALAEWVELPVRTDADLENAARESK